MSGKIGTKAGTIVRKDAKKEVLCRGVEGGMAMEDAQRQRQEMLERLKRLADRRVNDAVKLAFLNEETAGEVDRLDLSGLVELKRTDKSFEAKFVDQMKVLEMMRELVEHSDTQAAEEFFQALGSAAKKGDT